MITTIKNTLLVIFMTSVITACSSSPYNDPDSQRERSRDAQDEMRRDTSRY